MKYMADPRARELKNVTLEQLWAEAETLGRIEVDHGAFEKEYRVQIRCEINGSTVWATGKDLHTNLAVSKAINAAYNFGAGERP